MARVFVVSGGPTVFAEAGTPVSVIAGFSSGNARYIQGRPISDAAPDDGDAYLWDESLGEWAPGPAGGGGGSGNATSIRGVPVAAAGHTDGTGLLIVGGVYTPTDLATQAELDAHIGNTSNPHSVTKAQVGLALVENTALSTWAGSANLVTVGTLASGEVPWSLITGEPTTLAGYGITDAASDAELTAHTGDLNNPHQVTKAQVGLGSVENTALSTWAGSGNITTVGTLAAGAIPTTLLTGDMPDARIVQSNITQHQAALSIAWSQISSFSGSSLAQLATRNATDLEGTTLASTIVTSSLTTVGILGNLTVGVPTAGVHMDNNGVTQGICATFMEETTNNLGRFAAMVVAGNSVSSTNTLGQFRWIITQATPSTLKANFSLQVNTGDNLADAISITDARIVGIPVTLAMVAAGRIYLDGIAGTGDTYIVESSANTIQLVAGGVTALQLSSATVGALLAAGTTTRAPLGFTAGTNLTAAVAGRMEYDNAFHLTQSDGTRRFIVQAAAATKVTAGAPFANDGYVTVRISGTDFRFMTTA